MSKDQMNLGLISSLKLFQIAKKECHFILSPSLPEKSVFLLLQCYVYIISYSKFLLVYIFMILVYKFPLAHIVIFYSK